MSLFPTLWGDRSSPDQPKDPFSALHQEMNRLFDSFGRALPARFPDMPAGMLAPRVDIAETDTALEVTAELPGVTEDQIEVSLVDDVLTIKGEKKSEKTEEGEKKGYRLVERSYGAFQRSIALPFKSDPDGVKANFDKGVLKISVPKPPEAEAKTHRIAIGKS